MYPHPYMSVSFKYPIKRSLDFMKLDKMTDLM